MLILSLVWLVGGALVGLLVRAAALPLAPRGGGARWPLWRYAVVGAVAAVAGGWLGTLLFGSLFGSPTALWFGVLVTICAPYAPGLARRVSLWRSRAASAR